MEIAGLSVIWSKAERKPWLWWVCQSHHGGDKKIHVLYVIKVLINVNCRHCIRILCVCIFGDQLAFSVTPNCKGICLLSWKWVIIGQGAEIPHSNCQREHWNSSRVCLPQEQRLNWSGACNRWQILPDARCFLGLVQHWNSVNRKSSRKNRKQSSLLDQCAFQFHHSCSKLV